MVENKRPIAFSYIRISSGAQAKGSGRERQLEMSKNFAAARKLELDETFSLEDIGARGALNLLVMPCDQSRQVTTK
jgi:hypothetical protein